MTMLNSTLTSLGEKASFTAADYSIFVLLIVTSFLIGSFVGIKEWSKATTKDFLVGGRKMHPIPVSMSLIGGVISAISVLGNPTETYQHGTQLWMNIIGCFYGILVVVFFVLPTLYPLELISTNQYLEMRFNSKLLKKMGSLSQMINMSLYLGICLYSPSLALSSVTDLSTWASILILGLVCTIYIAIGGVKAVVYTDVVQTSIMFLGIVAVIAVVCRDLGGVPTVLEIANKGNRIEFFNFDFNPTIRHTFWSVQILGLYFIVSVIGISQPQFQRLNSVRTLRMSQGVCAAFYIGLFLLWSLFYFSGIVAYAAYADCDPLSSGKIQKADQIIPFLVTDKLKNFPGLAGLFVAAVYGAVLSSVSSTASAFAALVWEDFLCDWQWFRKSSPISPTNVTRVLTALAGLSGIGIAFVVGTLGTLFQAAYSISGAIIGPLDGLFITAIAAPWVNEKGAVCGFLTAFAFNLWLVTGQLFNGGGKSSPLPVNISGCFAEIVSNVSTNIPNYNELIDPSLLSAITDKMVAKEHRDSEHLAIFDISYCYFGALGIIIVFIVSSIVSFICGPNNPSDIDGKLVNKGCLKIYERIWGIFHRNRKLDLVQKKTFLNNQPDGIVNESIKL